MCHREICVSKKCIKCNKISIWTTAIQRIPHRFRIGWKKSKCGWFISNKIRCDPIKSFLFFSVEWKQNKKKFNLPLRVSYERWKHLCVCAYVIWPEKQVTSTIKKTPQTHFRSLKTEFAPFLSIYFVKYHRKLESSIKLFLTASRVSTCAASVVRPRERESREMTKNAMKFNRIGITIRIGLEKMNGQLINYAAGTYTQHTHSLQAKLFTS